MDRRALGWASRRGGGRRRTSGGVRVALDVSGTAGVRDDGRGLRVPPRRVSGSRHRAARARGARPARRRRTASTRSSPASWGATTRRSGCTLSAASRSWAPNARSAESSATGSTWSRCSGCCRRWSATCRRAPCGPDAVQWTRFRGAPQPPASTSGSVSRANLRSPFAGVAGFRATASRRRDTLTVLPATNRLGAAFGLASTEPGTMLTSSLKTSGGHAEFWATASHTMPSGSRASVSKVSVEMFSRDATAARTDESSSWASWSRRSPVAFGFDARCARTLGTGS